MENNLSEIKQPKKKINYQFRVFYAIGIFMVVAGHAEADSYIFWNELIHIAGFHMAMFVFASGYFYNCKNDANPLKYIWGKVKRLLVPYFLWNLFYALLCFVLSKFDFKIGQPLTWQKVFYTPFVTGPDLEFNVPAWFVIPLFAVEVYNVVLRRLLLKINIEEKKKDICLIVFNFLIGFLGIYLAMNGMNQFWSKFLTRLMYFAPFYSLGYVYKMYLEKKDTFSSFWVLLSIILIEVFIIFVYGHSLWYSIIGMSNFENPVLPYIVGILGIVFWLRISKILAYGIGKSKYLNMVGENTFTIMINHQFGFFVLNLMFLVATKFVSFLPEFDIEKFKSSINYIYLPRGRGIPLLFVIFGIAFSILMQKIVVLSKNKIVRLTNKKNV